MPMSRRFLPLLLVIVGALLLPASAGAWKYTFQDWFTGSGGSFSSAHATAKKCNGGKLGTYNYRSFAQSGGGDTEISFEILADLSVRKDFGKMKHVEVNYEHSPNIPEEVAADAAAGLLDFHETIFTRFKDSKHPKLLFRHGSMFLGGEEVLEPGEGQTKFDPKPGC